MSILCMTKSHQNLMKKLILLLLILSTTQSIFGQKQQLGFNLAIGETYYHTMQSSSIINEDVNGQKINIDLSLSCKTAFKITRLMDSVYDVVVSYQHLGMTMKLPNGSLTFNSDKLDEKDMLSSTLSAIIGKPFFMKMTKVGKILEVKNLDSVVAKIVDQSTQLSYTTKQQVKAQMLQAYGEKAFKGSFEMVTNIFSNAAVEKGSTWNITTKLESGMAATLKTTYEYKDKTDKYNLIIGNGKFETLDKDAYVKINGMTARYNLLGTMTSTIKIDVITGWIKEAKVNQSMSGNAEIKDNPSLPGGLIMPMTFENTSNFSAN